MYINQKNVIDKEWNFTNNVVDKNWNTGKPFFELMSIF